MSSPKTPLKLSKTPMTSFCQVQWSLFSPPLTYHQDATFQYTVTPTSNYSKQNESSKSSLHPSNPTSNSSLDLSAVLSKEIWNLTYHIQGSHPSPFYHHLGLDNWCDLLTVSLLLSLSTVYSHEFSETDPCET